MERLELSLSCEKQILNLQRLPIPPHPQVWILKTAFHACQQRLIYHTALTMGAQFNFVSNAENLQAYVSLKD